MSVQAGADARTSQHVSLVWAQARDADARPVIGAGNALPWHVPEDAARFRALTSGHPVLMGRATWDSLPARFRPLPGRTNVVVTRRAGPTSDHASVVTAGSIDEGLRAAANAPGGDETWVMGGAQVYAATIDHADRLEVTELDLEVEGDAWAPTVDLGTWYASWTGEWETSTSGVRYRFITYRRAIAQAGGFSR